MEVAADEGARASRRQLVHSTGEEDDDFAIRVDVRRRAEGPVFHCGDKRIVSGSDSRVVRIGEPSGRIARVGDDDRPRARRHNATGANGGCRARGDVGVELHKVPEAQIRRNERQEAGRARTSCELRAPARCERHQFASPHFANTALETQVAAE